MRCRVSRLSSRYIARTVAFGAIVSILFTLVESYGQLQTGFDRLATSIKSIENSFHSSLAQSLWEVNRSQTHALLDGVRSVRLVEACSITDGSVTLQSGAIGSLDVPYSVIPIKFNYLGQSFLVGELSLFVDVDQVYSDTAYFFASRILANFLKSLVVVAFSFYMFYLLVSQHLTKVARDIAKTRFHQPNLVTNLVLNRKTTREDELDAIVHAYNAQTNALREKIHELDSERVTAKSNAKLYKDNLERLGAILLSIGNYFSYFDKNGKRVLTNYVADQEGADGALPVLLAEPLYNADSAIAGIRNTGWAARELQEFAEPANPQFFLLQVEDGDGQFWQLASLHLPDGSFATVCVDITEAQVLAKRLQFSERLEAIGRTTSSFAHDINNLLAIIVGYADVATIEFGDNPKLAKNLMAIQSNSEKGAAMIRRLLSGAYSDGESSIGDLTCAVQSCVDELRLTIPEKCTISVKGQVSGRFKLDRHRIETALQNLVNNAVQAMPAGGKIVVQVRALPVSEQSKHNLPAQGRFVAIDVLDTGIGVDAKARERLFEPFFSTKRASGGSGLGLWGTYQAMKQMGGSIYYRPRDPEGSQFTLLLPGNQSSSIIEDEHVDPGVSSQSPDLSGLRVLIAEDEIGLLNSLRSYFEASGAEVISGSSVVEAIEYIEIGYAEGHDKFGMDIVISDFFLPDGNGLTILESAKSHHPNATLVLHTGASAAVSRNRKLEYLLVKKPTKFPDMVEKILKRRRQHDTTVNHLPG